MVKLSTRDGRFVYEAEGDPVPPVRQHHTLYTRLTAEEFAVVHHAQQATGLTMANFLRRCINSYLVEVGADGLVLAQKASSRQKASPA